MLNTLTTEELLRHCIQHGPMTEMERVLFERLEAAADLLPIVDLLDNYHFTTDLKVLDQELDRVTAQASANDELVCQLQTLEQELREARQEINDLNAQLMGAPPC